MWIIIARIVAQAFAIALINCIAQELRDDVRQTAKNWEKEESKDA